MRFSFALMLAAATLTAALVGTAGPANAGSKATYYLSLGDSAAAGYQPIWWHGLKTRGYADQLYDLVRPKFHELRLVKLGCSGETAGSLISGIDSPCTYPSGSQLDEATNFLQTHAGQVAFITIDIGGNDAVFVGGCWDPDTGVLDLACVQSKLPQIEANLASIIDALRAAAPGVPIAGMSYWDFFLGYWLTGPDGQTLAQTDEQAIETMNAGIVSTYQDEGVFVADVAGPDFFDTADFTDTVVTKEWGEIPVNVANDCAWTWFCNGPPLGPDIHPNNAGYGVIANAFAAALPF